MFQETLDKKPLYQQNFQVRKFKNDEDYTNIRSRCLAEDSLYLDPNFNYPTDNNIALVRAKTICHRPILTNRSPSRFDALQGKLGDCWVVCAMELIALDPDLFKHVVPSDQDFDSNYIGAFHFRIWQKGYWYDVVVDDILPVKNVDTSRPVYAHSRNGNVFWASLLEKAYAKINTVVDSKDNYYQSIVDGYEQDSLQDFTGGIVELVSLGYPPEGMAVKTYLNRAYARSAFLSCSFSNNSIPSSTGLISRHTYAVTQLYSCADDDPDYPGLFLLRILNPHGHSEWKGNWSDGDFDNWKQIDSHIRERLNVVSRNDGEFWMEQRDFVRYFTSMVVCYLSPAPLADNRKAVKFYGWKSVSFFGEWVKDISAGGSDPSTRYMNPQYCVKLGWSDENSDHPGLKDGTGKGCVLIDLISRSKEGRQIKPRVGFFVYLLNDEEQYSTPLKEDFFQNNQPFYPLAPKFSDKGVRSINALRELQPGKYMIVPCTEKKDEETQFVLRVFTEYGKLEVDENDTKIARSLETEGQIMHDYDKRLYRIFNEYENSEGEIDWKDLKGILQEALNQNIGVNSSPLTIFRLIFEWFIVGHSTDDASFSKDDCRTMIALLDENHSGKLNSSEFCRLLENINFWTVVYQRHQDEAGSLPVSQLKDTLSSIGYDVNKQIIHSISHIYANEKGRLILRDFIMCAVTIEYVLSQHFKEDINEDGDFTCTLERWVRKTLML